ncbi:uncharacterized protein A4U43_C04F11060 [Asparagus officinalis]|uniref:HMA domain-containing protein n=1 Tax=Asparagus officinalis TaxID=4686 RepID=A0A5P1F0F5_ASPOF|nr:heavy metal-associated isoprenylated plant protein 30 [Asparagus officinalis]ONK71662.1 uncharacterized protein A4U43_C04F11060 [Asparagus officinalis]
MANLQIVPARENVEAQHVEMMVPLYSYGCEKKVKKALSHLRGIHSVDVDYNLQKVTVWGICNKYDVLATIRKKRREARFWSETETVCPKTENETETDVKKEKEAPRSAKFNYKFSKSWKKKLFPLMLYLN